MSQPRDPGKGHGGFGTASSFGSIDGWTRTEAEQFLSSHPSLKRKSISAGGYQRYQFEDSSEVIIRPTGEVIRLPHYLYAENGERIRGLRLNAITGKVAFSNVWHNFPRNEHEWVVIDDSTN